MLALPSLTLLVVQCAPTVAPSTMLALVRAESAGEPLAIADNSTGRRYRPRTRAEAAATAYALVAAGHSIDMGLAQINSRTAPRLGLTIDDAFDACRNLAAAGRLMATTFRGLIRAAPSRQHALARTLSVYNTGHPQRGFANGYVARVYAAARAGASGASASSRPTSLDPVRPTFAQTSDRSAGEVGWRVAFPERSPLSPRATAGMPPADPIVFGPSSAKGTLQ